MLIAIARFVAHPVILMFTGLVLGAILILSFLPPTVLVPGRWNLGHAPAYAALVVCMIFALAKTRRTPRMVVLIGLLASFLGGMIEVLQSFVGRTTSLVDFTYNELGVVTALATFAVYAWANGYIGWRRA